MERFPAPCSPLHQDPGPRAEGKQTAMPCTPGNERWGMSHSLGALPLQPPPPSVRLNPRKPMGDLKTSLGSYQCGSDCRLSLPRSGRSGLFTSQGRLFSLPSWPLSLLSACTQSPFSPLLSCHRLLGTWGSHQNADSDSEGLGCTRAGQVKLPRFLASASCGQLPATPD